MRLVFIGLRTLLMIGVIAGAVSAKAQSNTMWSDWRSDVDATRWETLALVGGITALGFRSWDWGSSASFRLNPEGWFDKRTGSGGADKLGHAFSSYALTNGLAERLMAQGRSAERAAMSAALTTQALMLYVELFDGYSGDHGFAREDMIMNVLGTALAYSRQVSPALRDTLDFRLEYQPSGYRGFRPLSDYSGQKYLVAFKLAGLTSLRETPLRFLELQAGYYTRGFSKAEQSAGIQRRRHSFIGVGLNLNAVILGERRAQESAARAAGRLYLEHVQVPYTSVRSVRAF